MKRLLAQANARSLARLATAHVLLAFDFDGTLAPIIPDRDRAVMRRQTARLFAQVCSLYPCAVISARRRTDVAARLGVARAKYVVGNSGIEPGENLGDFARIVADARPLLEQWLDGVDGVDIEDKRYSLALHYRRSRQKRTTRQAIFRAVARLPLRMKAVPSTTPACTGRAATPARPSSPGIRRPIWIGSCSRVPPRATPTPPTGSGAGAVSTITAEASSPTRACTSPMSCIGT